MSETRSIKKRVYPTNLSESISNNPKLNKNLTGETELSRDSDGNILLFENRNEKFNPNKISYDTGSLVNESSSDLLSIRLYEDIFDIEEAQKVLDSEFRELKRGRTIEERITEFFEQFNNLIDQIPTEGERDSLKYLLRKAIEQSTGEFIEPERFEELENDLSGIILQFNENRSILDRLFRQTAELEKANEELDKLLNFLTVLLDKVSSRQRDEDVTLKQLIIETVQETGIFSENFEQLLIDEPDDSNFETIPLRIDARLILKSGVIPGGVPDEEEDLDDDLDRDDSGDRNNRVEISLEYKLFDEFGNPTTEIFQSKQTPFTIQVPLNGNIQINGNSDIKRWYLNGEFVSEFQDITIESYTEQSKLVAAVQVL